MKIILPILDSISGVFREGFWGQAPPPHFQEIFFNLLGFFKKKNPKNPPKFSRPYKIFQLPLEKFLDTLLDSIDDLLYF